MPRLKKICFPARIAAMSLNLRTLGKDGGQRIFCADDALALPLHLNPDDELLCSASVFPSLRLPSRLPDYFRPHRLVANLET